MGQPEIAEMPLRGAQCRDQKVRLEAPRLLQSSLEELVGFTLSQGMCQASEGHVSTSLLVILEWLPSPGPQVHILERGAF